MKKSFKILLATDYSQSARSAERYAVQFAMQTGSFLEILHVFQPPVKVEEVPAVFDIEKIEYTPDLFEERKLKDHAADLLSWLRIDQGDLSYECLIREGSASKQICAEAKEMDFDFIVVGSHGTTGFKEFFLGNHTWEVIKRSEVPVICVPQNAFFSGVKNIVYVSEHKNEEIPVIDFLNEFALEFGSELTLLHVSPKPAPYDGEATSPFVRKVTDKTKYPNLSLQSLQQENIIEGLNEFCVKAQADWLATSIEKTGFLERVFGSGPMSYTKKLTLYSHTPLLTIPESFKGKIMEMEKARELESITEADLQFSATGLLLQNPVHHS